MREYIHKLVCYDILCGRQYIHSHLGNKTKPYDRSGAFLPNQELSVLYGGPTLNYGGRLSLYFPYMLPVNMTEDLAHQQLYDLQGETRPICRT